MRRSAAGHFARPCCLTSAKDGIVADFEPGTLDVLKYQGHYVAIPWQIDIRVLYYRKSIIGSDAPKTWDDVLTLGKALKKGIYVLNSAGNASPT